MASISDLADIVISLSSLSIQQQGFGLPLVADFHTRFSERQRVYSSVSGMIADGFGISDPAVLAVGAVLAQNPRVPRVMVGRRLVAPSIQVDITPSAQNSRRYSVEVTVGTTKSTVFFDSVSTATVAEITAGLTTVIGPLAGVDATDQTTSVRVTATVPGTYFSVRVLDRSLLSAKQTHADSGIAADLAAIAAENPAFYGVALTTQGALEQVAAATWAESNEKIFFATSQDGDLLVTGSADLASVLKTATRGRTSVLYSGDPTQHAGAAWMGSCFPYQPGGVNFANRILAGVNSENLTESEIAQLKLKNANYYTSYGETGVSVTRTGKMASGAWIDSVRDRDWLKAALQEELFGIKVRNPKVGFDDRGIQLLKGGVEAVAAQAAARGVLAENSITVTAPKASQVSAIDRGNRTLGATPIVLTGRLLGAINQTTVTAFITE